MEHANWIKATEPYARSGPNANLPIARTLADFKTPACHQCTQNIHFFKVLWKFFMCCLLGSMVACLLVPSRDFSRLLETSRERSRDMVHYNCLDSLTAGLKQTAALCMTAHLYHDLYQGVWAGSVALPLSLSWLTRVLSTLPIPPWLGPGANDRAQHLALQAPTSHQAKKQFWSTL
jgi:hypothetical protein